MEIIIVIGWILLGYAILHVLALVLVLLFSNYKEKSKKIKDVKEIDK